MAEGRLLPKESGMLTKGTGRFVKKASSSQPGGYMSSEKVRMQLAIIQFQTPEQAPSWGFTSSMLSCCGGR